MSVLLAVRNCFRLSNHFVIPVILISGFSFRVIGINIGLPDSPDPREVLIARDVLNLIHFTAPPQIYNWPGTAWFYVIAAVGKLLSLIGWQPTEAGIILLARGINVLLSTTTLWFTYRIGAHCFNKRIGQIAAGLLAVAMLHATNESRFALVDIPATFCVTLFLWLVARVRSSSDAPTFQTAVWLGIIAGVGFAVKFTTVFAGFSLLVFTISRDFPSRGRRDLKPGFPPVTGKGHLPGNSVTPKKLATIIGVSAVTFTFLCPYWLIDLVSPEWNFFFEDFWYEATHYHRGHFGLIAAAESGLLHRFIYLWTLLKWGMGLPLALLASLGVVCALMSLKRESGGFSGPEVLLLAFVLPYLLFIGIHKVKFVRHLLILYPALTVLAAAACVRFPSIVKTLFQSVRPRATVHFLHPNTFGKWFGIVLGGVVVLYSLIYTLSFVSIQFSQPTKIAASDWIAAHIPQEDAIAIAPETLFDWLLPELDFVVTDEKVKWVLIVMPDYEVFQKYGESPQRYQDADWYPLSEIGFEETLAFYERVLGEGSRYELHKTFRCAPKFFGLEIISDSGAPFPMRALAHPELRLYRRRN
ncbi:hypothetical protein C6500_10430 [Candidatus Poribacteria bacterium]|nr:MAG: hypothetical protein C6500_10430 [Candidatus Poribacteria bacterium]